MTVNGFKRKNLAYSYSVHRQSVYFFTVAAVLVHQLCWQACAGLSLPLWLAFFFFFSLPSEGVPHSRIGPFAPDFSFFFFFCFFYNEILRHIQKGEGGEQGDSGPPASGLEPTGWALPQRRWQRPPSPQPQPPSPGLLPRGEGLNKTGGSHFFGEREGMCCPRSGTLSAPWDHGASFGAEGWDFPPPAPTPEQVSFSLCTRADLPLLSTLFIQTEAAGWFSHLCVCR